MVVIPHQEVSLLRCSFGCNLRSKLVSYFVFYQTKAGKAHNFNRGRCQKGTSNTRRIGLTPCAMFLLRYQQPAYESCYASASKKSIHGSYALTDERRVPTVCLCLRYGNASSLCVGGTASIPNTTSTSVRYCVCGCLASTAITDVNLRSSVL